MTKLSEDTFEIFASSPGDAKAQEAYRQIRELFENSALLRGKTIDKYLQGSYRNRTHIKEDSDVDVVLELQSSFYYNIDGLQVEERSIFNRDYPTNATYGFVNFKNDVYSELLKYFGSDSVKMGNKCIKVIGNSNRSDADVLACEEYRYYLNYSELNKKFVSGIKFWTRDGQLIVNWPKLHYDNGVEKNENTDTKFKGMVRILKILRNILEKNNIISEKSAPSYFLECLLFNVPNSEYCTNYSFTFNKTLNYLLSNDLSRIKCVNQIDYLFNSDNGWNSRDAMNYINQVNLYFNN